MYTIYIQGVDRFGVNTETIYKAIENKLNEINPFSKFYFVEK